MELLAPAGGFEQLRYALAFGADAVYVALDEFGMRASAANFSSDEIRSAVQLAHEAGAKIYVACNTLVAQDDLERLPAFLEKVESSGADALIVGDLGAASLARKYAPSCALHISTQASVMNSQACAAWASLGASRVVCAREMTLADIARMRGELDRQGLSNFQLEVFVHGAQCMAISGRCLLSSYLTGRSANRGACTQPCRWKYVLEEEKRPGEYFPVFEEDNETFIMNAKDLCMIGHLDKLADAGVDAVKIEGRAKKAFYVACVVSCYRRALDALERGEYGTDLIEDLESELKCISHRPYSTGFFFGDPEQAYDFDGYEQETIHVADVVLSKERNGGLPSEAILRCRNRFFEGEELEVISPKAPPAKIQVKNLRWLCDSSSLCLLPSDAEVAGVVDGSPREKVGVANRSCNLYAIDTLVCLPAVSLCRRREYRRSARHP